MFEKVKADVAKGLYCKDVSNCRFAVCPDVSSITDIIQVVTY
jgi:hypothetical protein